MAPAFRDLSPGWVEYGVNICDAELAAANQTHRGENIAVWRGLVIRPGGAPDDADMGSGIVANRYPGQAMHIDHLEYVGIRGPFDAWRAEESQ
jgi:hypothetical protein